MKVDVDTTAAQCIPHIDVKSAWLYAHFSPVGGPEDVIIQRARAAFDRLRWTGHLSHTERRAIQGSILDAIVASNLNETELRDVLIWVWQETSWLYGEVALRIEELLGID